MVIFPFKELEEIPKAMNEVMFKIIEKINKKYGKEKDPPKYIQ